MKYVGVYNGAKFCSYSSYILLKYIVEPEIGFGNLAYVTRHTTKPDGLNKRKVFYQFNNFDKEVFEIFALTKTKKEAKQLVNDIKNHLSVKNVDVNADINVYIAKEDMYHENAFVFFGRFNLEIRSNFQYFSKVEVKICE